MSLKHSTRARQPKFYNKTILVRARICEDPLSCRMTIDLLMATALTMLLVVYFREQCAHNQATMSTCSYCWTDPD